MKTLFDLVSAAKNNFGDKPFIREKSGSEIREKTFGEFGEDALRVAAFLKDKFGRIVHAGIIGPTSYHYLVSYLGTMIGGNTAVPIDAQLAPADICELLARADADVLFYDERFSTAVPAIKENCPNIKAFVVLSEKKDGVFSLGGVLEGYQPETPDLPDEKTLAAILFTSGTTGKAKGVMLSHGNFMDNVMCCDNEASPEDVLLTVLPIHHVYCFTCDILLSLRYGTCVCVNDSLMKVAQNLKLFRPTIILLVPMIVSTIYKQIKSASKSMPLIPMKVIAKKAFGGRLKTIYSGGAYLNPELITAYEKLGITIAQGYGMTECSPRITTGDLTRKSVGDVGSIVKGCEVRIVDGEITVRSGSVMQGYYKDEKSTAETIRDGWLYTGDLGYADDENRLFITGRKKNLIILSNGENVSPEELENKAEALQIAQELMVYSEDELLTLELFLGNELYKGKTAEETIAEVKKKVKQLNKALPSSKAIHRIRIRDTEFEKTASGKIERAQQIKGDIV
ncbi:MAG: AMP-binding protein [Ruminiclostridium sp.]|nr:AMP-binding protein [Ruminiclostridium sp.]